MSEAEWLASVDPQAMLEFLTRRNAYPAGQAPPPGVISDRKLRLFACACCREVWPLLTDQRSRAAVEVAERFADGEATEAERRAAERAMVSPELYPSSINTAAWLVVHTTPPQNDLLVATQDAGLQPAAQAALLRCIVVNPWRPVEPPKCHCGLLLAWSSRYERWYCGDCGEYGAMPMLHDWNTSTVRNLAQIIYDDRAFDLLPVLADALEEAGCEGDVACPACHGTKLGTLVSSEGHGAGGKSVFARCRCCIGTGRVPNPVIAHLRAPGPHVRGCWVLDLLLGKE